MNGIITLRQANGDESQIQAENTQTVDLAGIAQANLPFDSSEIQSLQFDGSQLTITLNNGESVTFEALLDENGAIVPLFDENGNLLFADITDLLSQLEATAAGAEGGNTQTGGDGTGFTPEDDTTQADDTNDLSARNLRDGGTDDANNNDGGGTGGAGTQAVPNLAPIAVADSFSFSEAQQEANQLTGNLLTNDSDPDSNQPLTVSSVEGTAITTNPTVVTLANGLEISVFTNGLFVVTNHIEIYGDLAEGQTAIENLTYTANDGIDDSAPATFTITVTGTNDQPVISLVGEDSATADIAETDAGLTASGTLTLTDDDVRDEVTADVVALDIAGETNGIDAAVLQNMLTVTETPIASGDTSGTISWNFNSADQAFDYLPEGETLVLTYTVRATDDSGVAATNSAEQTVTVTITGTNDSPVIDSASASDVLENNLNGSLSATVSDEDLNSTYEFVAETVEATVTASAQNDDSNIVSNVSVAIDANGDYVVSGDGIENLAEGETATITFNIKVTDGTTGANGGESAVSATKEVTLTITGTNDTPVITEASASDVLENNLSGSITETVTDTDLNDDYSFVAETVTATVTASAQHDDSNIVSNVSVAIDTNGDYVVSGDGIENLAEGETATITFNVKVTDGTTGANGGEPAVSATKEVTLTITGTNDTPVITEASASDVLENNLSGSITETVTDTDLNDDYSFVAETVTATVTASAQHDDSNIVSNVSVAIDTNGDYVVSGDGIENLAEGETATITFNVKVTDGTTGANGGEPAVSATKEVTLTITGTNDTPVITEASASDVLENDLSGSITETVTDTDLNDDYSFVAETVTATVTASAQHDDSNIVSNVSVAIDTNGDYVVSGDGIENLAEGETATITFNVKVTDGTTGANGGEPAVSATKEVTLTITGTNDTPVITEASASDVLENDLSGSITETVTDTDLNDDYSFVAETVTATVTASAQHDDSNIVSNVSVAIDTNGDYVVSGDGIENLAEGETATITFNVKVTDGTTGANGGEPAVSANKEVTLTITGTNDTPVITEASASDVLENDLSGSITETVTDTDLNDDYSFVAETVTATVTASAQHDDSNIVSNVSVAIDTNGDYVVSGDGIENLAEGETATITFNVKVTDGTTGANGGEPAVSATKEVTLTITGTNDTPVITEASASDVLENDLSGSITETVTDTDLNDDYSFVAETVTATVTASAQHDDSNIVSNVSVAIDTNGDYVVSGDGIENLAEGETATITFNVKVTDGTTGANGGEPAVSATKEVTLTITGTNDEPVVSNITGSVTEELAPSGIITDNGTISFTDIDLNDSHSITAITAADGVLGELTASVTTQTDGAGTEGEISWTYEVDATAVEYLAAGEIKTEVFTFNITDNQGNSVERTASITIEGTNDAPVINPAEPVTYAEDLILEENTQGDDATINADTVLATVNASDVDDTALTYSIISGNGEDSDGNPYFEINANGEVTLTAEGLADIQNSNVNKDSFTLGVTVRDDGSDHVAGNDDDAFDTTFVTIKVDDQFVSQPTIELGTDPEQDSGSSSDDNLTNINQPTFDLGNIDADVVSFNITVDGILLARADRNNDGEWLIDSRLGTLEQDPVDGSWSYTVDVVSIPFEEPLPVAIPDGNWSFELNVEDDAGNQQSSTLDVEVDTLAPEAPSVDLIAASDSNIDDDDITNVTQPTIAVSVGADAKIGDIITLFVNSTEVGTATLTEAGEQTVEIPTDLIDAGIVTEGSDDVVTVDATLTDVAGNESDLSDPLDVRIDTQDPAAPVINKLTNKTDTGIDEDEITNDTAPKVRVELGPDVEVGDVVTVYVGDQAVGTKTVSQKDFNNGRAKVQTDLTDLLDADGDTDLTFTATITDIAGNEGEVSNGLNVAIDTIIESISIDDEVATSDNTSVFTGTVADRHLDTVEVTVETLDGLQSWTYTASVDAAGNWGVETTDALADGDYKVTVTATDLATNKDSAIDALFTVDTSAVPAAATALLNAQNEAGLTQTAQQQANTEETNTVTAIQTATDARAAIDDANTPVANQTLTDAEQAGEDAIAQAQNYVDSSTALLTQAGVAVTAATAAVAAADEALAQAQAAFDKADGAVGVDTTDEADALDAAQQAKAAADQALADANQAQQDASAELQNAQAQLSAATQLDTDIEADTDAIVAAANAAADTAQATADDEQAQADTAEGNRDTAATQSATDLAAVNAAIAAATAAQTAITAADNTTLTDAEAAGQAAIDAAADFSASALLEQTAANTYLTEANQAKAAADAAVAAAQNALDKATAANEDTTDETAALAEAQDSQTTAAAEVADATAQLAAADAQVTLSNTLAANAATLDAAIEADTDAIVAAANAAADTAQATADDEQAQADTAEGNRDTAATQSATDLAAVNAAIAAATAAQTAITAADNTTLTDAEAAGQAAIDAAADFSASALLEQTAANTYLTEANQAKAAADAAVAAAQNALDKATAANEDTTDETAALAEAQDSQTTAAAEVADATAQLAAADAQVTLSNTLAANAATLDAAIEADTDAIVAAANAAADTAQATADDEQAQADTAEGNRDTAATQSATDLAAVNAAIAAATAAQTAITAADNTTLTDAEAAGQAAIDAAADFSASALLEQTAANTYLTEANQAKAAADAAVAAAQNALDKATAANEDTTDETAALAEAQDSQTTAAAEVADATAQLAAADAQVTLSNTLAANAATLDAAIEADTDAIVAAANAAADTAQATADDEQAQADTAEGNRDTAATQSATDLAAVNAAIAAATAAQTAITAADNTTLTDAEAAGQAAIDAAADFSASALLEQTAANTYLTEANQAKAAADAAVAAAQNALDKATAANEDTTDETAALAEAQDSQTTAAAEVADATAQLAAADAQVTLSNTLAANAAILDAAIEADTDAIVAAANAAADTAQATADDEQAQADTAEGNRDTAATQSATDLAAVNAAIAAATAAQTAITAADNTTLTDAEAAGQAAIDAAADFSASALLEQTAANTYLTEANQAKAAADAAVAAAQNALDKATAANEDTTDETAALAEAQDSQTTAAAEVADATAQLAAADAQVTLSNTLAANAATLDAAIEADTDAIVAAANAAADTAQATADDEQAQADTAEGNRDTAATQSATDLAAVNAAIAAATAAQTAITAADNTTLTDAEAAGQAAIDAAADFSASALLEQTAANTYLTEANQAKAAADAAVAAAQNALDKATAANEDTTDETAALAEAQDSQTTAAAEVADATAQLAAADAQVTLSNTLAANAATLDAAIEADTDAIVETLADAANAAALAATEAADIADTAAGNALAAADAADQAAQAADTDPSVANIEAAEAAQAAADAAAVLADQAAATANSAAAAATAAAAAAQAVADAGNEATDETANGDVISAIANATAAAGTATTAANGATAAANTAEQAADDSEATTDAEIAQFAAAANTAAQAANTAVANIQAAIDAADDAAQDRDDKVADYNANPTQANYDLALAAEQASVAAAEAVAQALADNDTAGLSAAATAAANAAQAVATAGDETADETDNGNVVSAINGANAAAAAAIAIVATANTAEANALEDILVQQPSFELSTQSDSGVTGDSMTSQANPILDIGSLDSDVVSIQILDADDNLIAEATRADADSAWTSTSSALQLNAGNWTYQPQNLDEGTNNFSVNITDDAGNSQSADLTVSYDGTDPVFIPSPVASYSFDIAENTSTVATIDTVVDSNTLTYSIAPGFNEALFSIDPVSGELSFTAAPDFEAPAGLAGNTYLVNVRATDASGRHADQVVTVNVQDVNDVAPSVSDVTADEVVVVSGGYTFSNDTDLVIPVESTPSNTNQVTSQITVSGVTSISDVNVLINIDHDWNGDLDIFLISPQGTRIELTTDNGSNSDNFNNTKFNDEASQSITTGTAPYTGEFTPEGDLSSLDGEDPNGIWTLEINDDFSAADGGTLLNWSIELNSEQITAVTQTVHTGTLTAVDPDTSGSTTFSTSNLASDNAKVASLTIDLDSNTGEYSVSGDFSALQDGEQATITFDYTANDGVQDSIPATVSLTITGTHYNTDSAGVIALDTDDSVLDIDSLVADANLHGTVSKIDMGSGNGSQTLLDIGAQDVLDLTDDNDRLVIDGDADDSVSILNSDWGASTGTTSENGQTYNVFTDGDATLLVDTDITVDTI